MRTPCSRFEIFTALWNLIRNKTPKWVFVFRVTWANKHVYIKVEAALLKNSHVEIRKHVEVWT